MFTIFLYGSFLKFMLYCPSRFFTNRGVTVYVRYHCTNNRHSCYDCSHLLFSAADTEENCAVSICFIHFVQHPLFYDWRYYRRYLECHRHCAGSDFLQKRHEGVGGASCLDLYFLWDFLGGIRTELCSVGHNAHFTQLPAGSPSRNRYGCNHHRLPHEEGLPRANFLFDQFPFVVDLQRGEFLLGRYFDGGFLLRLHFDRYASVGYS